MLLPPTDHTRRISSLDLLRGIALLGILLVNIESFALPFNSRINPTLYPQGGFTGSNVFAWAFTYLFADEKFISIFAILFGAGILLQGQSAQHKNLSPTRIHLKRMAILLLLGLAHAYLLWHGDILVAYALCGILIFPLRSLQQILLPLAFLLIAGHTLFAYSLTHAFAPSQKLLDFHFQQAASSDITAEIAAYRGGWLAQMHHRVPTAFDLQTAVFFMWTLWRCGGCMLLGMALHKWNFFTPTPTTRKKYFLLAAALIPAGLALSSYSLHLDLASNFSTDLQISSQPHYWGSLLTALGYISLLIPLASHAPNLLLAIGRTALSNYLLQTLLCTTFFYTFAHFAQLSRIQLLAATLIVWLIQLPLTTLYLRRFNRGPLEWAWHRLVYPRP